MALNAIRLDVDSGLILMFLLWILEKKKKGALMEDNNKPDKC